MVKNSVLYGYNTDGIFISNPVKNFKNKKDVKFNTSKIGKAYVTDTPFTYFEKHYRENTVELPDIKYGDEMIYNGQASSGKTTKLCQMVIKKNREGESPIVLSFTNKAIENVKETLKKFGYNENLDGEDTKICYTFDSYFCE